MRGLFGARVDITHVHAVLPARNGRIELGGQTYTYRRWVTGSLYGVRPVRV